MFKVSTSGVLSIFGISLCLLHGAMTGKAVAHTPTASIEDAQTPDISDPALSGKLKDSKTDTGSILPEAAHIQQIKSINDAIARLLTDAPAQDQQQIALASFYTIRSFQPVWLEKDDINLRGRQAMEQIRKAADDGLDPADYPLPALKAEDAKDLMKQAEAELGLWRALLSFTRDLQSGHVNTRRLGNAATPQPPVPDTAFSLNILSDSADVITAINSFTPPHEGYARLRQKLQEARAQQNTRLAYQIEANMERWRWLPRDLGRTHIVANIPEFMIRMNKNGEKLFETRGVVGKPDTPTPVFSDTMETVVINPSWTVPPGIMRREMIPLLQNNPDELGRRGISVIYYRDGGIGFRQPPGEKNALGRLKFLFPNDHAVYMHDTPKKAYFAQAYRALSNGCVRVQNPLEFAENILKNAQPDENWPQSRIEKLYGSSERFITLKEKIPVHIVYFTAFVTPDGRLETRDDIYNLDRQVLALMGRQVKKFASTQPTTPSTSPKPGTNLNGKPALEKHTSKPQPIKTASESFDFTRFFQSGTKRTPERY